MAALHAVADENSAWLLSFHNTTFAGGLLLPDPVDRSTRNPKKPMNAKSVITTTVGYMCLGLTGWMLSMPRAGWFPQPEYAHGTAMLFPLSIVLVVMGILAFLREGALDGVIFFGGSGFFWSIQAFRQTASAADPGSYTGWYYFVWAVFFCYVWLGSFKAGVSRTLFLLGLWLTLLALAIGAWAGSHRFDVLGGYLGLATAILAAITSAAAVIGHNSSVPTGAQPA